MIEHLVPSMRDIIMEKISPSMRDIILEEGENSPTMREVIKENLKNALREAVDRNNALCIEMKENNTDRARIMNGLLVETLYNEIRNNNETH